MENEIKPRINSARRLVAEIARIGGLEPPARCQSETGSENYQYAGRVLPYSNSDSLEGEVLKVVVANDQAKDNLCKFSKTMPRLSLTRDTPKWPGSMRSSRICLSSAIGSSLT